jgi:branched-subunit amino acid transport protein
MSLIGSILAMGAGVYLLRITGMVLRDVALPLAWERALGYVPVALLSALVVSSLAGPAGGEPQRLVAAAVAGYVAYRSRRMWACILSGLVALWLLRLA